MPSSSCLWKRSRQRRSRAHHCGSETAATEQPIFVENSVLQGCAAVGRLVSSQQTLRKRSMLARAFLVVGSSAVEIVQTKCDCCGSKGPMTWPSFRL